MTATAVLIIAALASQPVGPARPLAMFEMPDVVIVSGARPWQIEIASVLNRDHRTDNGQPAYFYTARLVERGDAARVEGTTDSARCPALAELIRDLRALPTPGIDLGDLEEAYRPPDPPPLDGHIVTLEVRARQADGSAARIHVRAASGEVWRFGSTAYQRLDACWNRTARY